MAFTLKQHDTRPVYIAALVTDPEDPSPMPIDLTDATSVKILMRRQGSTDDDGPSVDAAMTVEDAVGGIVSYAWDAADTSATGIFDVEFEITWSDGGIETIPNESYKTVEIKDDLG